MSLGENNRFQTGGAAQGILARELLAREAGKQSLPAGTSIGAFEVVEEIGRGGMGAVFRASRVQGGFEQTVAIKRVLATDSYTRERFRAETEILAGLSHPNIAQLIDGGEAADGSLYLAMEYVDGIPLDDYCKQHALGTTACIRLLLQIADALAHAHRNLVIHRDIKPNNILVSRVDGRPKLLDFGIAKLFGVQTDRNLTVQNLGPMTPTYAAPEQFKGETITVATDVYQFGVLLYQLISNGLPYDTATDDPVAWARAVLEADPLSLNKARIRRRAATENLPAHTGSSRRGDRDLDAIVQMALMKNPNQRYGSMDAFIADLEAFLDGRPVTARHGGSWYRITRFATRHRWTVLGSTLAVLALAATTFVAVSQALYAHSEAVRLRASVDLLNSVFKAADLSSGSGGKRSLEDLLDVAAKDVVLRLDAHPDLRAGVLLQVADAYASMGLPARAAPLYGQAIADFRLQSSGGLVFAQALQRGALAYYWNGDFTQAQQWINEATVMATGTDDDSATLRDGLYFTRWQILRSKADHEQCYVVAQLAVENAQRQHGRTRDELMQRALVSRGTSATDLRRYADGERDLLAAVDLGRRLYGDKHALTLKAQQALGWHYVSRGEPDKGLAILEPVGEIVREVFGENSQESARNLFNRGNAYVANEATWESALAAYREAARIYGEASSPTISIGALYNVASLLRDHGRCREALPVYAQVAEIWKQSLDVRDPAFRSVYTELAACALDAGEIETARANIDKGSALFAADEQGTAAYAALLAMSARIAIAERKPAQGRELLQQAIAIISTDPERATQLGQWRELLQTIMATDQPSAGPGLGKAGS
jgi:eukaryotic-like serine/threonine-protein kinase